MKKTFKFNAVDGTSTSRVVLTMMSNCTTFLAFLLGCKFDSELTQLKT